MHLYIVTRGIIEASAKFIKELSAKYIPMPFYDKKTGKATNVATVIHVRPIQLWEIVFPKEQLDTVLTTIFPANEGKSNNKKAERIFKWIRRFLPMRNIPKTWKTDKKMIVCGDGVDRIALGIKDDVMMDFPRTPEQLASIGLDPKKKYESESL